MPTKTKSTTGVEARPGRIENIQAWLAEDRDCQVKDKPSSRGEVVMRPTSKPMTSAERRQLEQEARQRELDGLKAVFPHIGAEGIVFPCPSCLNGCNGHGKVICDSSSRRVVGCQGTDKSGLLQPRKIFDSRCELKDLPCQQVQNHQTQHVLIDVPSLGKEGTTTKLFGQSKVVNI